MSLRIISESSARNLERGLHTGRDIGANLQDTYMSRMSKLVPGEALGAYPLFLNTIPRTADNTRPWAAVLLVTMVVLLVVVVLRWNATKSPEGKAQWPAVLLSAMSFIIWVGVLGSDSGFSGVLSIASLTTLGVPPELVSALALFAWTAIAPVLYTGDAT